MWSHFPGGRPAAYRPARSRAIAVAPMYRYRCSQILLAGRAEEPSFLAISLCPAGVPHTDVSAGTTLSAAKAGPKLGRPARPAVSGANEGVGQRIYRSAAAVLVRPFAVISIACPSEEARWAGASDPEVGTGRVEGGVRPGRPTRLVRPGEASWSQGGGPLGSINTPDPSDGWRQWKLRSG
jgi:hypothetical protein